MEGLGGEKALVFYGYQHEIPRIQETIRKVNPKLRVRKYEKAADADAWNRGEIDIPAGASRPAAPTALNLQQGGHHIIWYTLNWSLELYCRPTPGCIGRGQEHPVIIHRLLVEGEWTKPRRKPWRRRTGSRKPCSAR